MSMLHACRQDVPSCSSRRGALVQRNMNGLTKEEWDDLYEERRAKYGQFMVTSKVDQVVTDVRQLIESREEEGEAPPKIVIYSNFNQAFDRIAKSLRGEDDGMPVSFACDPDPVQ